jgi:hypothetical protein
MHRRRRFLRERSRCSTPRASRNRTARRIKSFGPTPTAAPITRRGCGGTAMRDTAYRLPHGSRSQKKEVLMHNYGLRNAGDTVLWNERRNITETVIRGTDGVMWYLSEPNAQNQGSGGIGPALESELVPVMPQAEHDSLASVQQNVSCVRSRFLQAANGGIGSLTPLYPSYKAIMDHYVSMSKNLSERFSFDEFAKSCYQQAKAWLGN